MAGKLAGRAHDGRQLAMMIAKRMERFDRKIFWRNMREYVAGGGLIAWFLWLLRYPGHRYLSIAGIVAVGFVKIYLWRSQRKKQPLDPSADVRSYQAALLERYDRQIEILRRVKYWYVAPLYAWMMLVLFTAPAPNVGRLPYFIVFTAFAASVIWLNDGYAVRRLRKARQDAESLIGGKIYEARHLDGRALRPRSSAGFASTRLPGVGSGAVDERH